MRPRCALGDLVRRSADLLGHDQVPHVHREPQQCAQPTFVDATRIGVDERPRELEQRLAELSPGADRAIELEVRGQMPELIEAELMAELDGIGAVDGVARPPAT